MLRNIHLMPSRPPSLRAVAAFEAAARHQSFARAAAELNLTQGAVSHAVRGLEERLGQRLFERQGRGVVLTEPGRVLAGRVRLSLGLLDEAFETRPWVRKTKLVLSVLPSFASLFLLPRLVLFRSIHPEIALEVRASGTLAAIGTGDVDIGLRYGPGSWAGLSAVKMADETLFPVLSPSYSGPSPASVREMLDHPLIGHPEFPWRPWLAAAGVDLAEPEAAFVFDESLLVLDAAATGAGIALGRSLLAAAALSSGKLVRLFDVEIRSSYSYWFVWNAVSPKAEAIAAFRNWLFGELSEAGFLAPTQ